MPELGNTASSQPKLPNQLKLISVVIVSLLIVTLIAVGYLISGMRKIQLQPNITSDKVVESTKIPTYLDYAPHLKSNYILLLSPSFAQEIKGKTFEPLSCLGYYTHSSVLQGKLSIETIRNAENQNDRTDLITGLDKIQNHEYEYIFSTLRDDGKTVINEKSAKTKADTIDLFSVCKNDTDYYILYNANISTRPRIGQEFRIAPHIYAAGGPQYNPYPYLAIFHKDGDVEFIKLKWDSKSNEMFTLIPSSNLRQFGYSGERKPEMLFIDQLMGKVENTIFITFETRCYECRDNPGERSLYAFSLDTNTAKEISFCSNYEANEQICYDKQGVFASLKQ